MSLTTALAARKAQYEADAAALSDTRLALDAAIAIERWYAAAVAQAENESTSVQAYSIAGRSVTRRGAGSSAGVAAVDMLRAELEALLFGGNVKVADGRDAFDLERA
jgi:hypothetical protein